MEKQSTYYVLDTIFIAMLSLLYVYVLRDIAGVKSWLYDLFVYGALVSSWIMIGLIIFERYGFPTWNVVKEVVQSLTVILILWIIVLIISSSI